MSNCITLYSPTNKVTFTSDEISIEGVEDLLVRCGGVTQDNVSKQSWDVQCIWWYLETCTEFAQDKRSVTIDFGKGRSSHTWRDFKATLHWLKPLMKVRKTHRFVMSDEYDGDATKFYGTVDFLAGAFLEK
jgi:hypothetical protein